MEVEESRVANLQMAHIILYSVIVVGRSGDSLMRVIDLFLAKGIACNRAMVGLTSAVGMLRERSMFELKKPKEKQWERSSERNLPTADTAEEKTPLDSK